MASEYSIVSKNDSENDEFGWIDPDGSYDEDDLIDEKGKLSKFIDSDNIAAFLKDEKLRIIGRRCHEGYLVDENSRKEWLEKTKIAIELAKLNCEEKTFPWRGAANIKLPIITDAAIKFAARAYSEIVKENNIVKAKVIGKDPDESKQARADRVSDYMSWQLIEKETNWEPDTDKLLHVLPIVGHLFRKRYYDSSRESCRSELCMADRICINAEAESLESARRVTDIIKNVSQNDVVSNQRAGIWLDVDLPRRANESESHDLLDAEDYYCFLEQHCWLDLDGDGYEEPYIVTLEKESMKVVRIVARYDEKCVVLNDKNQVVSIKSKQIFTDYIFIPNLDGSYYGLGFGQLMESLTRLSNTLINQLTDSGSLNNLQAGYLSKEVKIKSGRERFELGEWKRTTATAAELQNGIYPLPTREPSPTLFSLLGLILDLTRDLSSVKDVLAGDSPGMNVPATTVMALIEQGMKTFNAIYKRIYRSLKKEFKQLYCLNYEYLDHKEYYNVLDDQKEINRNDFNKNDLDILPVADPNMSTDMQRLVRAEALKGAIGLPGVDPRPIIKQWLEAIKVPESDIEKILPEQDQPEVPPHIQQMVHDAEKKLADVETKEQEIALKERELELKERELRVKSIESMTKAMKNIADAEATEQGTQLDIYKQFVDDIINATQINQQPSGGVNEQQRKLNPNLGG